MKRLSNLPVTASLLLGILLHPKAQEITLTDVTVTARNYKYLRAVDNKESSQPVKLLERKDAPYNEKKISVL